MNNEASCEINMNPINENCYEFKITRSIFTKNELIILLRTLKTAERYILPEIERYTGVRLQHENEILQ